MRQTARALVLMIAFLLALGLAGCDGAASEPTAIPATRPPTQPPEITRIVPPPPTPTPTLIPTLAPEVNEAVGSWTLRVTLDVTEASFVERLSYFGAANFSVDERGGIEGTGYFTPTPDGGRCLAQTLHEDPITFRISGSVVPTSAGNIADLHLIPDNRLLVESYRVICPDRHGDTREHSAPYLWPVLSSVDLLAWPLTLETGTSFAFQEDLSAASAEFEGTLTGEVQVNRG